MRFIIFLGLVISSLTFAKEPERKPDQINLNINIGGKKLKAIKEEPAVVWVCNVSAFTDTFTAKGPSKAEAKMEVLEKCTAQHDRMHCDDIECESSAQDEARGWICTLKPFTTEYKASGRSRAEAKMNVIEKCTKSNHQMHCDDPDCEEG